MKKKQSLTLYYLAILLSWAATFLYTPTLSNFAASQGMSSFQIGLISSGFGLMLMLLRAPLSILSDKLRKRKLLISLGMLAAFVCPLVMALSPTPSNLILFRFLSGLTPATWPIFTILVSSSFPPEDTPSIISNCNLMNSIGNVSGMLIGGILVAALSQIAAFYAGALIGLAAFILTLFMKEQPPDGNGIRLRDVLPMFTHPRLMFLSCLTMAFQIVITGTSTSFTPIFAATIGADSFQLGILGMLSMAGMGLASLLRRPFCSAVHSVRNALLCAFALLALSTTGIALCRSVYVLYAVQLLQGISGYMILVILMGECVAPYASKERSSAMGVFQSLFGMGMCLGPFLSGILYGILPAFGVFLCFGVLAAAAALVIFLCYAKLDQRPF